MTILAVVGCGAAVVFMYNNYKRNKRKIELQRFQFDALCKHLGYVPPQPPPPEPPA
jgi:hypothetical protein